MSRRRDLDRCGSECGCRHGCVLEDRAGLDDGWEREPMADWLDTRAERGMGL